jgi:hypothetical protein
MLEQKCPKCGMTRDGWKGHGGQGITMNGKTYCCEGCAAGTGCTCGSAKFRANTKEHASSAVEQKIESTRFPK